MIVVTGTIEIHPEDADEAIKHVLEVVGETNKEKGCLVYRFWRDLENPGLFRVYEEWESESDLQAHTQTDHIKAFGQKIRGLRFVDRSIKMMEVVNERSL